MEYLPDQQAILDVVQSAWIWLLDNVVVLSTLVQAAVVIAAFLVAKLFEKNLIRGLGRLQATTQLAKVPDGVFAVLKPLSLPLLWLVLQWLSVVVAERAGWPNHLIESVVSLITAWVIIRLATSFVGDPAWSRFIAVSAWSVAALNILGLLDPTIDLLDGMAVQMGDMRLSLLGLIKAMIALVGLLWLASVASGALERRIRHLPNLSPSLQVLFGKLLKITLYTVAIVVALNSVGIDLTAFAVFSGAVGLGVGFGLQKVVSNLISGVILLLDKSVKPGDVIAIGSTYGWINSLGARYVSVITRDGIEHLIPNEELISKPVENWSYTDKLVRQRMPIGVSYQSDIHKAMELAVQAASEQDRIMDDPEPRCLLKGFGDSSVDLELRVWIQDAEQGLSNVKSAIMLRIWDLFHENDIEFPYPQRDLHIRTPVPVRMEPDDGGNP